MLVLVELFLNEDWLIFGLDDAHELLYLIKSSFFYFLLVKLRKVVQQKFDVFYFLLDQHVHFRLKIGSVRSKWTEIYLSASHGEVRPMSRRA